MAYTTIDDPSDYFNIVQYGPVMVEHKHITWNLDFQPDWVWGKARNAAEGHATSRYN